MKWSRYGLAWGLSLSLLVAEIVIDHAWSEDCTGGLPRTTWFGIHVALAAMFCALVFWATPTLKHAYRLLVVVASTALGGIVYLAIVLYYAFTYRCDYF